MARPAFCPFSGKIQNHTKGVALVWQLQTALEHQSRAQNVSWVTDSCTSFIGGAVFASTLPPYSACLPRGGLLERAFLYVAGIIWDPVAKEICGEVESKGYT